MNHISYIGFKILFEMRYRYFPEGSNAGEKSVNKGSETTKLFFCFTS